MHTGLLGRGMCGDGVQAWPCSLYGAVRLWGVEEHFGLEVLEVPRAHIALCFAGRMGTFYADELLDILYNYTSDYGNYSLVLPDIDVSSSPCRN